MQAVVQARDKVCASGSVAVEVKIAANNIAKELAKVRNTALTRFHSRLIACAHTTLDC